MSWKDILKELSTRERMDAEEFAPEEMKEWEDEKLQVRNDKKMRWLRLRLHKVEMWLRDETTDEDTHEVLTAMLMRAKKYIQANDVESTEKIYHALWSILRNEIDQPFKR